MPKATMIFTLRNLWHNLEHNFVIAFEHATSLWGAFQFHESGAHECKHPQHYTIMELVLMIINIKCQKWQVVKICFIFIWSPNKGQLLIMMFTNSKKIWKDKIIVFTKKVNIKRYVLAYVNVKKITNKDISPLSMLSTCAPLLTLEIWMVDQKPTPYYIIYPSFL